jgi:hypothetical protein
LRILSLSRQTVIYVAGIIDMRMVSLGERTNA